MTWTAVTNVPGFFERVSDAFSSSFLSFFPWSWPSPGVLSSSWRSSANRLPHVMCRKPYVAGLAAYGCGQCVPCRINRRRLWTSRLLLEQRVSGASSFLTLTYEKEEKDLQPKDLQDWLKRFRKRFPPQTIRYFAVGEYGDETWRPHYHAAMFGFGASPGHGVVGRFEKGRFICGCASCDVVRSTWAKGFILVGELNEATAAYIAGYVTKKMTVDGDPRLAGRAPEFARMSLRRGIGAEAMKDVARSLQSCSAGAGLISSSGDVPSALRVGSKPMPLGRYLTRCLRHEMGFEEMGAPLDSAASQDRRAELCRVQEAAVSAGVGLGRQLVAESEGQAASLIARHKIHSSRRKL